MSIHSQQQSNLSRSRRFALGLALALVAMSGISYADFTETFTFGGSSLSVENLIGEVNVVSGGGSFEVEVRVQGADATKSNIRFDKSGDRLRVIFPKSSKYVYPPMKGGRSKFSRNNGSKGNWADFLGSIFGSDSVTVQGSGAGMEVWADITIRVPGNGELTVYQGVGKIQAEGVSGKTDLQIRSGTVNATDINGDLSVDTGSGRVVVDKVYGNVNIDTGSGSVKARDLDGRRVLIDTGSGRVTVDNIRTEKLEIDTGSGSVEATRIYSDATEIDTGSGSVTLELIEMGTGDIVIDTGSGGVDLILPMGASAEVTADSGSGGIDLDLTEAVRIRHKERDEVRFTIGNGDARIHIDTGSGGIDIRQ